jgi:small subunit ribosomal protein S21
MPATAAAWVGAAAVNGGRRYWEKTVNQETEMSLRMRLHDREPIGMALRRFKKLLERTGVIRELRKRKYYEKPCEVRRRAALRKQLAMRKDRGNAASVSARGEESSRQSLTGGLFRRGSNAQ